MKQKILISWIGAHDIAGINSDTQEVGMRGPLLTVFEHYEKDPFDVVVLLHTDTADMPNKDCWEKAISLIHDEILTFSAVKLHNVGKIAPTDLKTIYDAMYGELKKLPPHAELTYNLTSGTPAMYAASLALSMFQFHGTACYTVEKKFAHSDGTQVFQVSFPHSLPTVHGESLGDDSNFVAEVNQRIYAQAKEKVARTEASVLILGETGVGKTHLAKQIHAWSGLPKDTFIAVNCAEVAGDHNLMRSELFGHKKGSFTGATEDRDGAFRRANGGTLFLDELGEIPLDLQGMLLRALEEGEILPLGEKEYKKVKVRIIAATNKNLLEEMQAGRFRKDLFYRIANYTPRLYALREYSHADKEKILHFLLDKINEKYHSAQPRTLSAIAKNLLLQALWPGNIREMAYRLQSICLLSDSIIHESDVQEQMAMNALPSATPKANFTEDFIPHNLPEWLDEQKMFFIERAKSVSKNEKAAAQLLGMDQGTMRSFIKKYQENREE